MACWRSCPVVNWAVVIEAASPVLAVMGVFWRLSSRLTEQDTTLRHVDERVKRIEATIDRGVFTRNRRQ